MPIKILKLSDKSTITYNINYMNMLGRRLYSELPRLK